MLILMAAIINQKSVQAPRRHIQWETILRAADLQKIISVIYLGILGLEKEISEDCQAQFYQKYKKEILLRDAYKSAEEVIMWQLERRKIDALMLMDTSVTELYFKPEMAAVDQLEILVDARNLPQIHRFMLEMDYEKQEDRIGNGNIYTRVPGIRIVFYGELPIENKAFKKYFSGPLKKYLPAGNWKHIHVLSEEEEYLYRVGRLVESYITGMLRIREILDFWQYRNALDEGFEWKNVQSLIEKAKWQEFVHQVHVLASLWFDSGIRQQYGTALELEEYIFSLGRENRSLDQRLLPHERARLDFYWRDRDKEWSSKIRDWMFPPREYMERFFPVLKKYSFLLFLFWVVRDVRFLKRYCFDKISKMWFQIRVGVLGIKEKMKGLLKRMHKLLTKT